MNSFQRFMAAATFSRCDRLPKAPQVFALSAVMAGVKISDYLKNGEIMAECQWEARRLLDYDVLFVYGGNAVEAEALGCRLNYPTDYYPHIEYPAIESWQEYPRLRPGAPTGPLFSQLCRACTSLRHKAGDSVPVVGVVTGPVTLASQILGLEKLLFTLVDEPDGFDALLRFTTVASMQYGLELLNAGAHILMLNDPSASPNVIPKNLYQKLILPFHKAVINEFRRHLPSLIWLQITGYTRGILKEMAMTGANLVTIDYQVSLEDARRELNSTALVGNIKPLSFVVDEPAAIRDQITRLIQQMGNQPGENGWIISSGCEIPPESPLENVMVLQEFF